MAPDRIAAARTFLFVPGDRPDRFDKAAASGADMVILDLEDAVAPAHKDAARAAVAAWLRADRPAMVRTNAPGTQGFAEDLALAALPGFAGIMLPKAEAGAPLAYAAAVAPTIALVESAAGVATVDAVAATTGVQRLAFGTIDLALDLDIASADVLATIGTMLVVAARRHGMPAPVDGVTLDLGDAALVEAAVRDARARGFGGKLCIHPAQVAAARHAFRPTDDAVTEARRIVAADRAARGAAVALDGRMVDRPVVERAYRTLADAASAAAA